MFDKWNNLIIDSEVGWNVAYYKDYIGTLIVHTLDRTGDVSHSMTYNECYPKTIAAINLAYATNNESIKINVSMNFRLWKSLDLNLYT